MKKKIILIIILSILLILGITFAIYTYATYDEVIDAESNCFNIIYTKGVDIGSNENKSKLNIGRTYADGLSTTVKVKVDNSCKITKGMGTIYLYTEDETSDYLIANNLLNYEVLVSNKSVSSGTVTSKGETIIYDNFDVTTSEKSITVYIWLNGETVTEDNLNNVMKATYKGHISARVESR